MLHRWRGSAALVLALGVACGDSAPPTTDASMPLDASASPDTPAGATRNIAASSVHACAVRQAGLYCWGQDIHGELGTGEIRDSTEPVPGPAAGDDIVEVAARTGRTCIRRSTGEIACWGSNGRGEIGDGTRNDAQQPVAARGLDDAVQLAIDDGATCALRSTGRVACWGGSPSGGSDAALVPAELEGLDDVVEIRDGSMARFCARTRDGVLACWTFDAGAWSAPTTLAALSGVRSFALTSNEVICAIVAEGEIVCHNLSNGVTTPLDDSKGSVWIESGLLSVTARNEAGVWSAWNVLPSMLESTGSAAIPVSTEVPIVEVSMGGFNICALRADSVVVCANANTGSLALTPVELPL